RAKVYMSCTASRRKRPSSVANRNLFKSCPSPARWSGSSCRRERLSNQVVLFRSPSDPPQCPECCANPRLLCRGTNGSNPSPSSGESCKPSVPRRVDNEVDLVTAEAGFGDRLLKGRRHWHPLARLRRVQRPHD